MKTYVLKTGHVLTVDLDAEAAYLTFVNLTDDQEVYTVCPNDFINVDYVQDETDLLAGMELLNLKRKFDETLTDNKINVASIKEANFILKRVPVI